MHFFNITNGGHKEMNKENKRPFGLDAVLLFSLCFGSLILMICYFVLSLPLSSAQYPLSFPIAQLTMWLAGFLLILSVVGLWLQKKIAYYSLIFAWIAIMYSGHTFYVIEILSTRFYLARPGSFPHFLVYGTIPIAIVFYMVVKKKEIENWMQIENLYQFEKLVGIFSGLLAFLGVQLLLNSFVLIIMDFYPELGFIISFIIWLIIWLIAAAVSFIVYDIVSHRLIRRKLKGDFN